MIPFRLICVLMVVAMAGCSVGETVVSLADDSLNVSSDFSEETETSSSEESLLDDVVCPYPDRTNPFVSVAKAESAEAQSIQIKGFVEVGDPKAVLAIGESIAVVSEGERRGGITLLKISPPEIVFEQQGKTRRLSMLTP